MAQRLDGVLDIDDGYEGIEVRVIAIDFRAMLAQEFLLNDTATAWMGPIAPGGGATLQNNQCILNGSGSSVISVGNVLTVNAALTFKPAFAGNEIVYLFAYTASANTGFQTAGTWSAK